MALYLYQAGDGEKFYDQRPMAEAHPTYFVRTEAGLAEYFDDAPETSPQGKVFRRVFVPFRAIIRETKGGRPKQTRDIVRQFPYASVRNAGLIGEDEAPHADVVERGVPHENVPIIQSQAHESEIAKRHGWTVD